MRQHVAGGIVIAFSGALVLLGWWFDVVAAKSLMSGWRVMVPATAASFTLIGVALILAGRTASPRVVRSIGALALIVPLVMFVEQLSGLRTGIESWFGIPFDISSEVSGRMSPLTSVCFCALAMAVIAATLQWPRALTFARVASGATLLTAWLAVLALAFDAQRFADVARFPGMAVLTILLTAVASWSVLTLTFEVEAPADVAHAPLPHWGLAAIAFGVPLALGWISHASPRALPEQVTTSVLVFALTVGMAAVIWYYAAQLSALREERERMLAELEARVDERTHELAAGNAALRDSQARLREADRAKDEFLATLAHELRNPLAPIRSAVAILRSAHVTEGERRDARLIIERQVTQLARLIDDLLDVNRIAAGKLPMHRAVVPLVDVLNLAVITVRPHLDLARHHLTVAIPDESILIDADQARLAQVFANLLHNACKYTEPGGEIMLSVSLPNDDEVAVAVRDNGIGIPPEFLPRLFERFTQVDPAADRSQGGLGIGLSLVEGIVRAHDGRVAARSPGAGLGSEFIVTLPIVRVPDDNIAPHTPAALTSVTPRRVLVADDNRDSADALALLLRLQGHVVDTAADGEAAFALAERVHPDAMLLDLGMPRMNGYELCKKVRATAWGASALLIAQTGWAQAQDRARTKEAGFDVHLTKPVDPDQVCALLAQARQESQ